MAVLVVLETLALGLLGVLVAGLLRSHAEILRRLHHLEGGVDLRDAPLTAPAGSRATGRTSPGRASTGRAAVAAVTGTTPSGDAATIAVGRRGEATMLVFLSTGCHRCGAFWAALRVGSSAVRARIVIVARDPAEESPTTVGALAPADIPVVLSSRAWDDYAVPGSPYAVYVDERGKIAGRGTAASWPQLVSLVTQAERDRDDPERVDRELQAAGLRPGHPSLHPIPASSPPA